MSVILVSIPMWLIGGIIIVESALLITIAMIIFILRSFIFF